VSVLRGSRGAGDADPASSPAPDSARAWGMLGLLGAGYVGVYLCRKNLAVAVPLLGEEFGASREEIGRIASAGTLTYAAGKLFLAPLVDRFGGRRSFVAALLAVSGCGALSALSPSLATLTLAYSGNRLGGSPAWAAMVKQVSAWLAFALGVLSLSYVFGGAAAVALAGAVAEASGGSWRAIMLVPALVLAVAGGVAWVLLPRETAGTREAAGSPSGRLVGPTLSGLLRDRGFLVVCGLSFVLTLVREIFNDWTVDFIKSEGGAGVSLRLASFLSLPFDLCGATGILATGFMMGRLRPRSRRLLVAGNLAVLAISLLLLTRAAALSLPWLVSLLGLIGFCGLGPYSLLAGYFSVRLRGPGAAGTVSGMIDSVGYLAGVLAGSGFGWILDRWGYGTGFIMISGFAWVAVLLAFFLPSFPSTDENA
jgi:sugar phosphate permease